MNTVLCSSTEDWNPLTEKPPEIQKLCSGRRKHRNYHSSLNYGFALHISRQLASEEKEIIEQTLSKALKKQDCDLIKVIYTEDGYCKVLFHADITTSISLVLRTVKGAITKKLSYYNKDDSSTLWEGKDRIFTI